MVWIYLETRYIQISEKLSSACTASLRQMKPRYFIADDQSVLKFP